MLTHDSIYDEMIGTVLILPFFPSSSHNLVITAANNTRASLPTILDLEQKYSFIGILYILIHYHGLSVYWIHC